MKIKALAMSNPMQKLFAGAIGCTLILSCFFAFAPQARAAQLTQPQIQAILNLLSAFGVSAATIQNVSNILNKKSY